MNFSAQTKAWILLVCLVLMSGGAVFMTSYEGGAKLWLAIVAGLITASSNVYHALAASPADKAISSDPQPPK